MSRLAGALELVTIGSVSGSEAALAGVLESRLRAAAHLEVERVGDNLIARSVGRHATRVVVAGHLDTVPGDPGAAHLDGDRLVGLGACDMKGSLSVMVEVAVDALTRPIEVTWIFYAREEVSRRESGLLEIAELRPELLQGDVALLAEPTGGVVEAGCQGTLRVSVTLAGARAHTARPATGRNAIHRLAGLLERVASYVPRTAEIDGVLFTEQLQAVLVHGGVAANVVPDEARVTLNHRVAPDRGRDEAVAWLRGYLAPYMDEGDEFAVDDWAPGAPPSLGDARLQALVALTGQPARGKVGWTDVATFHELGVPATNFGAGDPLRAHRSDEFVTRDELDDFARVLRAWLA